jgi:hypothetical protein
MINDAHEDIIKFYSNVPHTMVCNLINHNVFNCNQLSAGFDFISL